MMEIQYPLTRQYWRAISSGVLREGYTDPNQVTSTGLKTLIKDLEPNKEFVTPIINTGSNKTYYVSSLGDDLENDGSILAPFKSISKVNSLLLNAGDSVLFQCGDTFYGTLEITHSGDGNNHILYGKYGIGANPIITGFSDISEINWVNTETNIWESENSVSELDTCNVVLINNIVTAKAKYPKIGFLHYQDNTLSQFTSDDLAGVSDFTGAEVVMKTYWWTMTRRNVISHIDNTIGFSPDNLFTAVGATNEFFFQNTLACLREGEGYIYNSTTKKISVYGTTPPESIKISTISNLVYFNASNITIDGIDFEAANESGIYCTVGENVYVKNSTIKNIGFDAMFFGVNNTIIDNCTISNINGNGINYIGDNLIVVNSRFINIGTIPGSGQSNASFTGIYINGKNSQIQNNTFEKIGYCAIRFVNGASAIKNNHIDTFCTILWDGAGIYTAQNSHGGIIENNEIKNGCRYLDGTDEKLEKYGAGIYMDDFSKYQLISGNTILNCWSGVHIHNASEISIISNNVTDCKYGISFIEDNESYPIINVFSENNTFIADYEYQFALYVLTYFGNHPISGFGKFDYNSYSKPVSESELIQVTEAGVTNQYNLSGWKAKSLQDFNSQ